MEKKTYFKPRIELTKLDREINLVLLSEPPLDPGMEPDVPGFINPFKWLK